MADAKTKRTKVITNIPDASEEIPDFSVKGSRVVFPGWLRADPGARGEDTEVPKIEKGDVLKLKEIEIEAKQTQPPNRYSEAGLIKELEKRGIGRPSTYASIMRTIIDRGYVEKEGRTLLPTDTGDVVSSFLEEHFADYIGDDFTSDMEDQLDDIAEGNREYVKVLSDFYKPFSKAVASKEDIEKLTNLGPGPKEFKCPKCQKDMVIKLGRGGKFLSCGTFPECDGARMIDGTEVKDTEPIGKHPETGEDIFILTGRFGPYIQLGVNQITKDPETGKTIPLKKRGPKPRRAAIPEEIKPEDVTLAEATRFLLLPRELGEHPKTGEPVVANSGKFGPYIVHAGDYRSLKGKDNPYDITYKRAMNIFKEPKQGRKGETLIKELGLNQKTKKLMNVYESKSGRYLRKGFKRVMLPEKAKLEDFTIEDAIELLKIG
jgi:DNA topoisomerase-1